MMMMGDVESHLQKCSMSIPEEKPTIYVEIQLKKESAMDRSKIQSRVKKLLQDEEFTVSSNMDMIDSPAVPELREHISSVMISIDDEQFAEKSEDNNISRTLRFKDVNIQYCIYNLNYEAPASETLDENCDFAAATHWILPSSSLNGLWETLIYDCHIKSQLLNFVSTTLLFSDKNVDSNVVSWNRVILLHGPPGTGKTSLCKALAHKLAIRFNHRYSYGQLIEINSHSLFSKWFSESGKLVLKMFEKIQEFIDDARVLVVVLIDEVESLAHARKSILAGNEPSDAIRVVNAILTQIDAIKKYPNVIILTTSNVTGAIDLALVDRADIKQFIGLPSAKAIFKIYDSCIKELLRAGIIYIEEGTTESSHHLVEISEKSKGLSGRTLRKLPFLAHALFLKKKSSPMSEFLDALSKAIDRQFEDMKDLKDSS